MWIGSHLLRQGTYRPPNPKLRGLKAHGKMWGNMGKLKTFAKVKILRFTQSNIKWQKVTKRRKIRSVKRL
jgi:hypothetical protein